LLHEFIAARLQTKLEKLKPDEFEAHAKLSADHQPMAWLEDAARRAGQIQLASHTLKAIHPDARGSVVNLRTIKMLVSQSSIKNCALLAAN
jgi:CRISPR-associated protein Csy1